MLLVLAAFAEPARRSRAVTPEHPGDVVLVHVDDALAVVDKPAGLVVHRAPGHQGATLVDVLGELLGGGEDPVRPGSSIGSTATPRG